MVILALFVVSSYGWASLIPLPEVNAQQVSLDQRWISLTTLREGVDGEELIAYSGVVYAVPEDLDWAWPTGAILHEVDYSAEMMRPMLEELVPLGYLILSEKEMMDASKVYVAVHGVVYDLTHLGRWSGGNHLGQHSRGEELTHQLVQRAPHSEALISRGHPVAFLGYHPHELETKKTRSAVYVSSFARIYDFTQLARWSTGSHLGRHSGGEELTYDLRRDAPHPVSRIDRGYVVGLFIFTPQEAERWVARFPNALVRDNYIIDQRIDEIIGLILE